MEWHTIISLPCLLVSAALPMSVGSDDLPPEQAPLSEDGELELAVQMTVYAYEEELAALRSMQDPSSTVNAAARLRKAICLRYKLYGMSFNYDCYKERCYESLSGVDEACSAELKRLAEHDFYGVMPVRALFCSDHNTLVSTGETLRCAEPLPQEETHALANQRQEAIAQYREKNEWLQGGPGFSRESAWVISAESDVIPRERHLMRSLWQRGYCGQSLHCVEGRYYDCLYMVVTRDGEPFRVEQWFDITAYWKALGAE